MSSRSETRTVTAPAFRAPQTPAHPRAATPARVEYFYARRQVQQAAMVERIKAAIGPEASARYFRSPAAS